MDSVPAENPPGLAWAVLTHELTGGKERRPNDDGDDDDDDDDDMENVSEKAAVDHPQWNT